MGERIQSKEKIQVLNCRILFRFIESDLIPKWIDHRHASRIVERLFEAGSVEAIFLRRDFQVVFFEARHAEEDD